MINFSRATFKRFIIHTIHKKEREEEYSSVTTRDRLLSVSEEAVEIIKKRVTEACGKQTRSFKLEIADSSEGSFFYFINNIWDLNDQEFIERSIDIANLLGRSQKRRTIGEGILLITHGIASDEWKFAMVIKAELQEAFKTSIDEQTQEEQLTLLTDLFMSPDKKFFKIGFIKQSINREETYPNSDFSCLLFDDQFSYGKNPAEYFYEDFLGFSLDSNEKILTRSFYEMTQDVIKKFAPDHETRKLCLGALKSYVHLNQSGIIDPREFGQTYFSGALRDKYNEKVLSDPRFSRAFTKNPALIDNRLKKRQMPFRNVVISGKEDSFDDEVKVIQSQEEAIQAFENMETTLVEIKGKPYQTDD